MSDQSSTNGRVEQNQRPFNANEHLIQLKSKDGQKDYLPVQWRLVWFREQCPQGTIETEMLHLDLDRDTEEEAYVWNAEKKRSERVMKHANGFVVFRAIVKDGKGGIGTGTKSEKAASFPDFIEKAETGAIGRALAALGYGTQFAPELDEEHRIVDSPVERHMPLAESKSNGHMVAMQSAPNNKANATSNTTPEPDQNAPITERQIVSIRKLSESLNRSEPENLTSMTLGGAREVIQQLSQEYNIQRQSRKAS